MSDSNAVKKISEAGEVQKSSYSQRKFLNFDELIEAYPGLRYQNAALLAQAYNLMEASGAELPKAKDRK